MLRILEFCKVSTTSSVSVASVKKTMKEVINKDEFKVTNL